MQYNLSYNSFDFEYDNNTHFLVSFSNSVKKPTKRNVNQRHKKSSVEKNRQSIWQIEMPHRKNVNINKDYVIMKLTARNFKNQINRTVNLS